MAGTLNNLGRLQRDKNELDKAEKSYAEALEIYRRLAQTNPQTYLPDVGMIQINLGIFYLKSKIEKYKENRLFEGTHFTSTLTKNIIKN